MKDFFDALKGAFPVLQNHPIAMARTMVLVLVLVAFHSAKGPRRRVCQALISRMSDRMSRKSRFLYLSRGSWMLNTWKYYTSESTGGQTGDDIIWTLLTWPGLKPIDSFRLPGMVGMVQAFEDSEARLHGRWGVVHDLDNLVGAVPARGLTSKLQRIFLRFLIFVESL